MLTKGLKTIHFKEDMLPTHVSHIIRHVQHPLWFKTAFHTLSTPSGVHHPESVFFPCGEVPDWKSPWPLVAPAHTCPWAVQWDQRHEILPNPSDTISENQTEWFPPRFKLELEFSNSTCAMEHFVQMELTGCECVKQQCGPFELKGCQVPSTSWFSHPVVPHTPSVFPRPSPWDSQSKGEHSPPRYWGNWPTRNVRGVGRPAQRS